MNKSLIFLLPLCCLFAACAADTPRTAFIENCPEESPADRCVGERNKIKIIVSARDVKVEPKMVCTRPGETIAVDVVGIPAHAKVATVPKDGTNGWILSSKTGEGATSIMVPEGTSYGDYSYFALSSTGQCVDPMIRVEQ
jgi:hypothetical protein